jgi:protein-S-isoprenylcysteine O-methyltransferase Ste14
MPAGSTKTHHGNDKGHMLISKLIVGISIQMAVFGCLLMLPAGTLTWWRAWVFIGVVFVGTIQSTVGIYRVNRAVLNERMKPPLQKGQPFADKIIVLLFIATFVGLMVFIPLDVFRFHLLAKPETLVSSLGLALFVAGWWIVYLGLKENAFAAPVVKYQEERHQTVIDTGLYGIVRHPIYAGAIPLLIGMPLWLESYAATLLAGILIGLLGLRVFVEEEFLIRNLKGYDTYTERVRYRIIPFLW